MLHYNECKVTIFPFIILGIPPEPTATAGAIVASGITLTVAARAAGTVSGMTEFNFTATFAPSSGTAVTAVNQLTSYTGGTSTNWAITGIPGGTYTLTVTATNSFGTSSAVSVGSVTLPARKIVIIVLPPSYIIITFRNTWYSDGSQQ